MILPRPLGVESQGFVTTMTRSVSDDSGACAKFILYAAPMSRADSCFDLKVVG